MILLDNFSLRKTHKPGFKITGYTYGDIRFNDGSWVIISNPAAFNRKTRIITTRNGSQYRLGCINQNYANTYEDAENRMFDALEKKLRLV
tara:strand:- start:15850 stop:16119 length:270 start_codon:yes stop_codon:yes gene_type:complete